jgi:hypothetical protein
METRLMSNLIFRHMVEFPTFDCVFCSTEIEASGKTRLYLIFNDRKKVYLRNGLRETWDEVINDSESVAVREGYHSAIENQSIPRYSA